MKKVILLGDSIRCSYNDRVKELLEGRAEVWGPADNCRFSKYTLWSVHEWINEGCGGKPDIVHWNNGIWDTFRRSERIPSFTELDEYLHTMSLILGELRSYGCTVIFANTTPVGPGFEHDDNDRIDRYNAAIEEYMKAENVPVDDLHSLVAANIGEYIGPDLLHLSPAGIEAVSLKVAAEISKYL